MRILADENFPLETVDALMREGHDVIWARIRCPGARDTELLDLAEGEDRILVTLDKDFWQITVQRRKPLRAAGMILFRVHPATPAQVTPLVMRTLAAGHNWPGHASVVTADRVLMVASGSRPD